MQLQLVGKIERRKPLGMHMPVLRITCPAHTSPLLTKVRWRWSHLAIPLHNALAQEGRGHHPAGGEASLRDGVALERLWSQATAQAGGGALAWLAQKNCKRNAQRNAQKCAKECAKEMRKRHAQKKCTKKCARTHSSDRKRRRNSKKVGLQKTNVMKSGTKNNSHRRAKRSFWKKVETI